MPKGDAVRTIDATSGGGFLIVTRLQQRVVIQISDAVRCKGLLR